MKTFWFLELRFKYKPIDYNIVQVCAVFNFPFIWSSLILHRSFSLIVQLQ